MIQWGTTLDDYATYQLAKGLAYRTIQNRHECMTLLAKETGKPPGEINKHDLLIRLSRDITPSSKQRERSYFRSYFGFLLAEGHRTDRGEDARARPVDIGTRSRGEGRAGRHGQAE